MIVDRITETRVYIEDESGSIRPFPRAALPAGVREGDALVFAGGAWQIDTEKTEKRRKMMKNRLERLLK